MIRPFFKKIKRSHLRTVLSLWAMMITVLLPLKRSMALYNSVGTTGTYEGHGVAPEIVRAYKEVWDSGEPRRCARTWP